MSALVFFAGFPCDVYTDLKKPVLVLIFMAATFAIAASYLRKTRPKLTVWLYRLAIAAVALCVLYVYGYFTNSCQGRVIFWQ